MYNDRYRVYFKSTEKSKYLLNGLQVELELQCV